MSANNPAGVLLYNYKLDKWVNQTDVAPPTDTDTEISGPKINGAAIGGGVGAAVALIVFVFGFMLYRRREQRHSVQQQENDEMANPHQMDFQLSSVDTPTTSDKTDDSRSPEPQTPFSTMTVANIHQDFSGTRAAVIPVTTTQARSLNNPQCIAIPTVSYSEYSPVFRNPQGGSGGEDNHGIGAGAPLDPLEQLQLIRTNNKQVMERLQHHQAEIEGLIISWKSRSPGEGNESIL